MDHKNFNQIGWEVLDFDSDLDSSNVSGFDCIPQVVQKNYEPEFSYISVVLFNKLNFVRRNLVFQGSVKSHQWSLYCWSIFFYFCVIDSLAWFWMGSPCKNSQLMLVFLNLGPTSFQLCIDNLPDNAISNIGICADNTTVSGSWIHFLKNSTCLIWHFK